MIRANFWERLRISYIQVFEILRDLRKHQQLFIDFICATQVLILIELNKHFAFFSRIDDRFHYWADSIIDVE